MFEKEAEKRITEQFGTSGEYVTRQRIYQTSALEVKAEMVIEKGDW